MGERRSDLEEILVVIATVDDAAALAPVARAFRRSARLVRRVIVTGEDPATVELVRRQHVADVVDLPLRQPHQSAAALVREATNRFGQELRDRPSVAVVVRGHTTSALGAAMAASLHGIPVVHLDGGAPLVELIPPYPEAANHPLIVRLASLHLPTNERAVRSLQLRSSRDDGVVDLSRVGEGAAAVVARAIEAWVVASPGRAPVTGAR